MRINSFKKILVFILLSIAGFNLSVCEVFADEVSTAVSIPVQQIYETNNASVSNTFTYVLEAQKDDSPMPLKSTGNKYVWTMSKDANIKLQIPMDRVGTYAYKVYQNTKKQEEYQYDTQMYWIEIQGYLDSSNQFHTLTIVRNEDGDKTDCITFTNKYESNRGLSRQIRKLVNTSVYNEQIGYTCLGLVSLIVLVILVIKKRGVVNDEK